jgi:hypothetical protein
MNRVYFRPVLIDSIVSFRGKRKKVLQYLVGSISLVPYSEKGTRLKAKYCIPEIFWQ